MTDIPRHADLPDLAYPYALDALSPADRRAVEHALDRADEPTATEFRATVRAVRDTLAAMTAADSVPAPPHLEAALLAALPAAPKPARPLGISRRLLAAAAAVLILGSATGIGAVAYHNHHVSATITAQQIRTHADAQVRTIAVAGGGTLIVDASRQLDAAAIALDTVPRPATGHTIQLWLIPAAGQPHSAGLLDTLPTAGDPLIVHLGDAGTVAVTIEPAGGSPLPTTDPIAAVPID
ncbi:anti-sigma factor [Nocardia sp. BMG111209]|uniref:anti-sigma factor n=1 Tax=Nocardia sp. BMG111209 TaxID=1160137 RepID=UPI000378FC2F|nr:anti-sigma factor [Nocardia sp. BMG111209]